MNRPRHDHVDCGFAVAFVGYLPGDPENNANAGMTVFGGTMVLSAILAQSLIIVNFP